MLLLFFFKVVFYFYLLLGQIVKLEILYFLVYLNENAFFKKHGLLFFLLDHILFIILATEAAHQLQGHL